MTDLPTLWVNLPYNRHTMTVPGATVSAYVDGATQIEGEVAYVPAARLEEAERLLAQWTTAADYDRERTTPASDEAHDLWARIDDKPHFALPTIQAVLDERDAAHLEIARLRAFIQSRTPDHCIGSTDPRACHPTCKRDDDGECVDHWPGLREHECDAAPGFAADEECDRCAALAALTPKEPSDG